MILSRQYFFSFLYIICIVVSFFPNYELTFLVWLATFIITIQKKYSITIFKYISIFSAILLIAVFSTLFYENPFFSCLKDFTYLLKPILGILLGYQLLKVIQKKHINVFINAGLVLSIIHIGLILFALFKFHSIDMNLIRDKAGFFSDYEVYVLIVLLFHNKFELSILEKKRKTLILIIGFSVFMYLSRTNFLQFVILALGMKGYFILNSKSIKVILVSISVLLTAYAAIFYANPKRNGKGLEALMYKIKIAPQEAFKTKINKNDWKDFNDNYRSFENIITINQVSLEGERAILFGKGLGSTLNLGQKIYTTDGSIIQYISVAHNGFMTIYLKSGLLGVILLIAFLIMFYSQTKSTIYLANNVNLLLIGTCVFLIISTWVFMGLYFKLDNKSIIIGFLLALKEKTIFDTKMNTEKVVT
jgi:hypothetical protein